MTNQNDAMEALNQSVDSNLNVQSGNYSMQTNRIDADDYQTNSSYSCWGYWQNQYYPYVIRESYPVYLQEKAVDKGKQAFEIIKMLNDKGLTRIEKVKDFIEAMDSLLKIL